MIKFRLYMHICPNGKKYVGQTIRNKPQYRWCNGQGYKGCTKFYRAILKYGWDNIRHIVWEMSSQEDLDYGEKYLIKFYNTQKEGYNVAEGGSGGKAHLGYKASEESRRRMSEAQLKFNRENPGYHKGRRKFTEKERIAQSERRLGKPLLKGRKPRQKNQYLLPNGKIVEMCPGKVKRHYQNYILIKNIK